MLARHALRSVMEGSEIVEFSDGGQLLDSMNQDGSSEPGLILMDVNMPRVTGHEALLALRSRPEGRHIPVVMFSTSSHPDTIARSYQFGANAYIVKPTSMADYQRMAHAVSLCFLNRYLAIEPGLNPWGKTGKSVMIIEDNADHSALMELSLKQSAPGLGVVRHSSAEEALDFLNAAISNPIPTVDLILLDLYLPTRRQGLDLLARIRDIYASRNIPAVPIVVFSASDRREDIRASYRQHANAYLIKSADLARSSSYLKDLCNFWWNTIAYPRRICQV